MGEAEGGTRVPRFPPQTPRSFVLSPPPAEGYAARQTAGRREVTAMSSPKTRRKWTARQKLKIVLETLQSDRQLAALCRREGVAPNLVYA